MERSEEQKQTIAPDYPEVSQQTLLLAKYLVETEYQDLPSHVIEGMKALILDWLGSALAGKEFYPSDFVVRGSIRRSVRSSYNRKRVEIATEKRGDLLCCPLSSETWRSDRFCRSDNCK